MPLSIDHDFKLAFLEECIIPALALVENAPKLRVKEKDYNDVLDLDGRIRDFKLPSVLAEPIGAPPPTDSSEFLPVSSHTNLNFILNPGTSLSSFNLCYGEGKTPRNVLRMIRVKAQQEKLVTLLYLHRTFFYAHIRDHRPLVQRMFLPSCLATFSAASELIRSVREIYSAEPELTARVSLFWYNGFLATVCLCFHHVGFVGLTILRPEDHSISASRLQAVLSCDSRRTAGDRKITKSLPQCFG